MYCLMSPTPVDFAPQPVGSPYLEKGKTDSEKMWFNTKCRLHFSTMVFRIVFGAHQVQS